MKKSQIAAAILLITALFSSCCACRQKENKNHKPLLATEWTLVQMDGKNITEKYDKQECPRVVFGEDNSFGGYGGCNSMGGDYRITPSQAESQKEIAGSIELANIFSTKRTCPNGRLESALFTTLAEVDAFTIEGTKLFLFKDGELKLVFEAQ